MLNEKTEMVSIAEYMHVPAEHKNAQFAGLSLASLKLW